MKVLINEKLSEHKYKTPEGYLICVDAVLARTGKQSYRRSEIFDTDDETEIEVDRTPEEVFSEATLASFENKPITVEHPDEDVNSENFKDYSVGFVRDVHRGKMDGQDVILGTLVIQDAQTIEEIENGEHTDLSCGYDCDINDDNHPQQRNIRGNHVALCECGRAGNARIVDSKNFNDAQDYVINFRNDYEGFREKTFVNANSAIDALKKFAKEVALRGWGTRNITIISISPNDGYMRLYGNLYDLLKSKDFNDSIKDDWSRGISVTVNVGTESLIQAAKNKKVIIGNGDNPEKLIGRTSLRFRLPNGDDTAYLNMENNNSVIKYNLYDDEFTYKEFGGKTDFTKAKLTTGMKKLQDYVVNQLTSAGIRVFQSKVEIGGSSKFNSVWRQAQAYNDSLIIDELYNGYRIDKELNEYVVYDKHYNKEYGRYKSLEEAKINCKYNTFDSALDDCIEDATEYRIVNYNGKWYYEMRQDDGFVKLVGPYISEKEAREYFMKHRPNEKLSDSTNDELYSLQELREMRVDNYKGTDIYKIYGQYSTNPNTSNRRFNTLEQVKDYIDNSFRDSVRDNRIPSSKRIPRGKTVYMPKPYSSFGSQLYENVILDIIDITNAKNYGYKETDFAWRYFKNGDWMYVMKNYTGDVTPVGSKNVVWNNYALYDKPGIYDSMDLHKNTSFNKDEETPYEEVTENLEKNIKDDNDLSLLRQYFSERQPNKKMELRNKLKSMNYREGVSGVNSRELMWVELNGKRYEVKNLSNVKPLDSIKDSYIIQSKYNTENYLQEDNHFGMNKKFAQKFNSYEEAAKKANILYSDWDKHINIIKDSTTISQWHKNDKYGSIIMHNNNYTFISANANEDRDFNSLDEAETYAKQKGYIKDSKPSFSKLIKLVKIAKDSIKRR